ncbi:MAG: DUF4286 family protein [Barnesiella sp.]|nr:DUF4286 family protein [Barnesiella sp.]
MDDFLTWLRTVYATSAREAGMSDLRLSRIDFQPDPETLSFAFSAAHSDDEAARRWHDNAGGELRTALSEKFGERVLYFTTYMEEMDV